MASFKEIQLKKQVDRIFGSSPQAEEIKAIVIKANTTGYTQDEINAYIRQKEEDLKAILDYFVLPNEPTVESKTIYDRILSTSIIEEDAKPDRNEDR